MPLQTSFALSRELSRALPSPLKLCVSPWVTKVQGPLPSALSYCGSESELAALHLGQGKPPAAVTRWMLQKLEKNAGAKALFQASEEACWAPFWEKCCLMAHRAQTKVQSCLGLADFVSAPSNIDLMYLHFAYHCFFLSLYKFVLQGLHTHTQKDYCGNR